QVKHPQVPAGPHSEPDHPDGLAAVEGAAHGIGRTGERGEESVARRVQVTPVEGLQLPADDGMVSRQELPPSPVGELLSELSRADDVGEQQRREEMSALSLRHGPSLATFATCGKRPLRSEISEGPSATGSRTP